MHKNPPAPEPRTASSLASGFEGSKGCLPGAPRSGSGPCRTAGTQAWHLELQRCLWHRHVVGLGCLSGPGEEINQQAGTRGAPRVLAAVLRPCPPGQPAGWGAGDRDGRLGHGVWDTLVAQR